MGDRALEAGRIFHWGSGMSVTAPRFQKKGPVEVAPSPSRVPADPSQEIAMNKNSDSIQGARRASPPRQTDLNLADTADDLGRLILAAWMAAEALADADHQGAIQTVLYYAEHKLGEIQSELAQRRQEARGAA
jgi:hypothetical protein